MYHLLINHRPFCQEVGCIAYQQRAAEAGVTDCQYFRLSEARSAAVRLSHAGFKTIAIGLGDCPVNAEEVA